ncbi:MAG: hypothetical protein HC888_00740 [Candidatus Competibacteraceae bacterium]|nr:hypothetical protein [Candidatus Competibacteraceae bacterium]
MDAETAGAHLRNVDESLDCIDTSLKVIAAIMYENCQAPGSPEKAEASRRTEKMMEVFDKMLSDTEKWK